jgi:hypothetical protein
MLLSDMAPDTSARLAYLLRRESWVTAVLIAEPEQAQTAVDSPEEGPWHASEGSISAGPELTSRVGTANADVLLLDWDLAAPLPTGALESLAAAYPQTLVAALSARAEERAAASAAGVATFIHATTPEDAVAALRATLAPER